MPIQQILEAERGKIEDWYQQKLAELQAKVQSGEVRAYQESELLSVYSAQKRMKLTVVNNIETALISAGHDLHASVGEGTK